MKIKEARKSNKNQMDWQADDLRFAAQRRIEKYQRAIKDAQEILQSPEAKPDEIWRAATILQDAARGTDLEDAIKALEETARLAHILNAIEE